MPAGKALFFPILNAIFGAVAGDCNPSIPGVPCNLANLRLAITGALDGATLIGTIDGHPFTDNQGNPVNLYQQRVQSPVLTVTLPSDNVYGLDPSSQLNGYAPNVSDGYWLMVSPLSKGRHTIHFKGTVDSFTVEVTYNLTVS